MRYEEKAERLTKLKETDFRQQVLIPLLKAMGFSDVYEFHGTKEKGKDLIFREVSLLKEIFVHAGVVSTTDITATVGDSKSAERALDQTRLALEEPYVDLYTGRVTSIDRCWVITSGRILPSAIESISGHLNRSHLDKLVRFLDGPRVIGLLDEWYPEYWTRKPEYAYYSRYEMIDISTNHLDEPFDKDVDDLPNAGNLKTSVYTIKKKVNSLLLTIKYDLADKLAALLRSNHPWEIITIWEELSDVIDREGHAYIGREVREIQEIWDYLADDLEEYERRFQVPKEARTPRKDQTKR